MRIWSTYFFYDCPGPSVWVGDFVAGLTAAVAQQAAQDAAREEELGTQFDGLFGMFPYLDEDPRSDPFSDDYDPTFTPPRPAYEPDSQTIIVDDMVAGVELDVRGHNSDKIFLQRCEWHAVEAIQKRLTREGYKKKKKDRLDDLI